MRFADVLQSAPVLLAEGAVVERLKRGGGEPLDPHALHAGFPLDDRRALLTRLWQGYVACGREFDLPLLLLAPTWRANPERVAAAGLPGVAAVNAAGVALLRELQAGLGSYGDRVVIGGVIGPRGDAYDPRAALGAGAAYEFHTPQIRALAAAGCDVIQAATLPALSEAEGIAAAIRASGCPGLISFVLREDGTLLDGTPLHAAIARLDGDERTRPLAYMVNCTHPDFFLAAMAWETAQAPELPFRVIGLQANAAALRPEQLNDAPVTMAQEPAAFAARMLEVHRRYATKILGGCCGTDDRHIRAIAAALRDEYAN